jgi:hypothetical protein
MDALPSSVLQNNSLQVEQHGCHHPAAVLKDVRWPCADGEQLPQKQGNVPMVAAINWPVWQQLVSS